MIKLILLLAVISLASKLLIRRWPWDYVRELIDQGGRSGEVKQAQLLLGVSRNCSRDQVIEAHRRLIVMVHPDRGGSDALVHEANAARDLLLDKIGSRQPDTR